VLNAAREEIINFGFILFQIFSLTTNGTMGCGHEVLRFNWF
jgi:hypothetical protein